MTIEEALAQIPEEVTAWELQSRAGKTRFRCELSWLVNHEEYCAVGHARTEADAIMAACRAYAEGKFNV